jgi:hypothetical protein
MAQINNPIALGPPPTEPPEKIRKKRPGNEQERLELDRKHSKFLSELPKDSFDTNDRGSRRSKRIVATEDVKDPISETPTEAVHSVSKRRRISHDDHSANVKTLAHNGNVLKQETKISSSRRSSKIIPEIESSNSVKSARRTSLSSHSSDSSRSQRGMALQNHKHSQKNAAIKVELGSVKNEPQTTQENGINIPNKLHAQRRFISPPGLLVRSSRRSKRLQSYPLKSPKEAKGKHLIADYLQSFVMIDDETFLDPMEANERDEAEARMLEKLRNYYMTLGAHKREKMVIHNPPPNSTIPIQLVVPSRPLPLEIDPLPFGTTDTRDHRWFVLNELKHVREVHAIQHKNHLFETKRLARAVDKFWNDRVGLKAKQEEMEVKALRALARSSAREIRRFWGSIESLVRAMIERLKEEEAKVQSQVSLAAMLQKSKNVLAHHRARLKNSTEFSSRDNSPDLSSSQEKHQSHSSPLVQDDAQYPAEANDDFVERPSDIDEISSELDSDDDDSELAELQADQDLSPEELLKRYYGISLDPSEPVDFSSSSLESEHMSEVVPDATESPIASAPATVAERPITPCTDEQDTSSTFNDTHIKETSTELAVSVNENSSGGYTSSQSLESLGNQSLPAEIQEPGDESTSPAAIRRPVPLLFRGALREYQHAGLDWLATLYDTNVNGILADEMVL